MRGKPRQNFIKTDKNQGHYTQGYEYIERIYNNSAEGNYSFNKKRVTYLEQLSTIEYIPSMYHIVGVSFIELARYINELHYVLSVEV